MEEALGRKRLDKVGRRECCETHTRQELLWTYPYILGRAEGSEIIDLILQEKLPRSGGWMTPQFQRAEYYDKRLRNYGGDRA